MKKALSLMLVLVLVLGMSTTAFAAGYRKLNKNPTTQSQIFNRSGNTGEDLGDVIVQDEYEWESGIIYFDQFDSGYAPEKYGTAATTLPGTLAGWETDSITEKDVKESKITLKTVFAKGAKAIDEVTLEYAGDKTTFIDENGKSFSSKYNPYVKVDFVDSFTNNNPDGIEFQVKIYIVVDGRQWADSGFTLEGDFMNDHETYYEATDGSVYMGDGVIITADGYMKNVEMDLGEGVFAYGKMFKDRNYYGKADIEVYDKDDEFMEKYELDAVYHINEAGLKAVVEYVILENEDSSSYVYTVDSNGNLVYTGKNGSDKLDLADTYYLSTKFIDVEEIEPDDDGGEPSDEIEDPVPGGGDGYTDNVNDNPGTGC